ncbi:VTT domain-containing protein [Pullulanibacillus sp. KACC 23026]|uniref:TVP38/TMEM64 family protein n=1 Tax=Pullulanibacillus sp. KACC 23026 TaxID=3028315 RepID=UPI0023B12253|nr:VTT domain-containing protein [Pullulanibacillus sp. KACC 23026]WEG11862.1 VTT domain-containing protein [Pullulanibacillus sp. KACC 23026]
MKKDYMKFNKSFKSYIIIGLVVIGVVLFFYYDRHHAISHAIQSYGSTGRFAAILMMTLVFLTPIPSEGLLLIYFNVYGIFLGLVYAWISYVISIIVLFVIARYISTNFIRRTIKSSQFETVDRWLNKKGIIGLLIVRLLPIPAFIVNCVMGAMPSVNFYKYFITAIIAILPYYITSSLLYFGFSTSNHYVLIIGFPILLGGWWLGVKIKKMNQQ